MKLKEDENWWAIKFECRTLLRRDEPLFPAYMWKELLETEVIPGKGRGRYVAVESK